MHKIYGFTKFPITFLLLVFLCFSIGFHCFWVFWVANDLIRKLLAGRKGPETGTSYFLYYTVVVGGGVGVQF